MREYTYINITHDFSICSINFCLSKRKMKAAFLSYTHCTRNYTAMPRNSPKKPYIAHATFSIICR